MTNTCAIRTGSGPVLRRVRSIRPGVSSARSTASSSTGGPSRSGSESPPATASAISTAAISATAPATRPQVGTPRSGPVRSIVSPPASTDQPSTSKNPIQPSSANSVLWAWNMNGPACGKRSSQIPRCAWPWTTVSVNSVGSSLVPVGK